MTSSRKAVLSRVREALSDRPDAPAIPRDYASTRTYPDVAGLAAERIAEYRAAVHRVAASDLVDEIAGKLITRGVRTMITPSGLPESWQTPRIQWWTDEVPLDVEMLDASDGVLTGCALVIAETGSIVLDGGTGQGRRAVSLLPDYHLCVVYADQIVATVPEAVRELAPERPLTFISGPSATSDIELDRVEGVHGPRTLEVLIVDSS